MPSSTVLHAAGEPSTWHTLVDTGLGIVGGLLVVGLFFLWLRRASDEGRRSGLE
jgi:nitrate reductase gamma subunit